MVPAISVNQVSKSYGALRALEFADKEPRMHRFLKIHYGTYELKSGSPPATVLRALDDYFDGNYTAASAGLTVAGGGSAAILRNEHGVVIKLLSTTEGLRFNLAAEGVNIKLTT